MLSKYLMIRILYTSRIVLLTFLQTLNSFIKVYIARIFYQFTNYVWRRLLWIYDLFIQNVIEVWFDTWLMIKNYDFSFLSMCVCESFDWLCLFTMDNKNVILSGLLQVLIVNLVTREIKLTLLHLRVRPW